MRAILLAGAGLILLTVVWRACERRLPVELTTTGVKYATVDRAMEMKESAVAEVEAVQRNLDNASRATEAVLVELANRLDALERLA